MNFSESKLTTLRPQRERKLATFALALGVAAAFFVPYIVMGQGYFIFYGDFNVQQIPFYQMCHQAIREGNIGWNWLTDLGANFIGSYSFYLLGSPFFWLTLPFPNWMVPYLMGPLLILKFGCAALTGYCYLRRFTKTAAAAQLGGLLYAFSGFSVYNVFFNHFHEAIIYFPLLLLAMELLLTENRRGMFAIMVCLCAVVNYFFFFGMVVFCVIYFFVRVLSHAVTLRPARFFALIFEAVLGLAMSAALLLPSVLAIADNNRISNLLLGWNAITYGKEQIYLNVIECFFFPPDIPARPVFFPGANVKWSSLGGWLPIFSMVGVFTWFIHKKGSWLKRMIGICVLMAMVPILNSAFYAFNSAYYARWFYMPILMMCLATVMLTEDRTVDWRPGWRWVMGITLAFALVIGFFPQKDSEDKLIFGLYSQDSSGMYVFRFWTTCALAIIGLLALRLLIGLLQNSRTRFYRCALVCVCLMAVAYGNLFIACGRSHSYEVKDVMIDQLIEGQVTLPEDDDYRVDVYDGVDNTSMYLGYPGINAFHSVVPASVTAFYDYIGVERSVASRPDTDDVALRSLLSVRYLLNRNGGDSFIDDDGDPLMNGFNYLKTSGGYYIYENENYIPYGFSYDYYMTQEYCDSYGEDYRTRLMLKAVLLNDEQIARYGGMLRNIEELRTTGLYDLAEQTSLSLSDAAMQYDCARLATTAADDFALTDAGFRATVNREAETLVFFSVPYEQGWTAYVNGRAVTIEQVNVGFMAVPVGSGQSIIEFRYETPGLTHGLMITAGSIVVFLIYFIICRIRRNRGGDVVYPEGEELLTRWREDDRAELREEQDVEASVPMRSLLEEPIEIPHIENGFDGGFRIDQSLFGAEKSNSEPPPDHPVNNTNPGDTSSGTHERRDTDSDGGFIINTDDFNGRGGKHAR